MQKIARHITELLYTHDCVIIPELGGFIVRAQSAVTDYAKGELLPPSRSVSFNQSLSTNDGLLIHHIAQARHITYEHAADMVSLFVKETQQRLSAREIVTLPDIGRLYVSQDNKILFTPDSFNFLLSAYSLPVIHYFPVMRGQQQTPESYEQVSTAPIKRSPRTFRLTPAAIAGSAAILLMAIALPVIYFNNPLGSSKGNEANFVAIDSSEKDEKEPQGETLSLTPVVHNDVPAIQQMESKAETDDVAEADNGPKDKKDFTEAENRDMVKKFLDTEQPDNHAFVIILGAFSTDINAKKLSRKLMDKGYTPYTDKMNGMKRVGVRISCTPEELDREVEKLKERYKTSAWVLNKEQ